MIIYGVALLAACVLIGQSLGEYLGVWLGIQANVGGVGLAMLLLVSLSASSAFKRAIGGETGQGIRFWSAMYIPIVVAMAARQDVVAAVSGGGLAIIAGVLAVVLSFALVPLLSRIGATQVPADVPTVEPDQEQNRGQDAPP